MRYRYEEIRALPQAVQRRAIQVGTFDPTRMFIDLPENFDFAPDTAPAPVLRGLGDAVALIAKPIANLIGLSNCSGCAQRQATLNKAVPYRKSD